MSHIALLCSHSHHNRHVHHSAPALLNIIECTHSAKRIVRRGLGVPLVLHSYLPSRFFDETLHPFAPKPARKMLCTGLFASLPAFFKDRLKLFLSPVSKLLM